MFLEFARHGLCVSEGRLSAELRKAALKELQSAIDDGGLDGLLLYDQQRLEALRPAAAALCKEAQQFAAQLIGKPEPQCLQRQLWLTPQGVPEAPKHVDGASLVHELDHGDVHKLPSFCVIVGVPLSDWPQPEMGNLAFVSGGHWRVADFVHQHWDELSALDATAAFERIFEEVRSASYQYQPLCVRAGDMYACHALLPHQRMRNDGPVRPVWYFRFGRYERTGKAAFASAFPADSWPAYFGKYSS